MNKNGAIIILEDDSDDQFVIAEILKTLGYENEVLFFSDGEEAMRFLNYTDETPFLILSDIELPKLSGFELRKMVQTNARLNVRCVPYLFFTSGGNQQSIIDPYSQSVQGFFNKPSDFGELRNTLITIIEYWKKCTAPN